MENVLSLILLFLSIGVSNARVVSVSPGPLLRVEGQPVSLRCDVTDYEGPREQDFEWTMTVASKTIPVISTFDPKYSDSSLSDRVTSGDLAVVRLGDSSVELKIQKVRSSDSATYTCSTPSTDSVITGNYKADVTLKVIADTLKVTTVTPEPIVPEGGDITLFCNISRQFTDPTYLSVTWSLNKTGVSSADILSFGPDGGVVTASSYAQRYAEGGLRLAVRGDGSFGLVITRVTQGDAGTYMCTGKEWTHEAGGRWKSILGKTVKMGAVAVTPTAQSLSVEARSNTTLNMDDTLTLTCLVAVANLASVALEVNWLMNGGSVVSLGRDGVVVDGSPLVGLERAGPGDFRLVVRGVRKANEGEYSCRVRAWISRGGPGGGWYQAAEKTSNPVQVLVTRIEPSFTMTVKLSSTPKVTGDPAELACLVSNITHLPAGGRLGVSWEYTPLPVPPGDRPTTTPNKLPIGSLDAQGNLKPELPYQDRLASGAITLTRVEPDTFKLRFLRVQESDKGEYSCSVTTWSPSTQGDMENSAQKISTAVPVQWDSKRPSLTAVAKRVREATAGGATFEMSCTVSQENLQDPGYSVLVQTQEKVDVVPRTVMSLSPDSVLQHGAGTDPKRRDSLVLTKTGPAEFNFRLAGVQLSDRGFYWCSLTSWTKQPGQAWTKAASAQSNKVQVNFQETGPSFSVAIHSDTTTLYPWETAKLDCALSVSGASPKTEDLAYEVRWYQTPLRGGDEGTLLASVDRFGLIRKQTRNGSSDVSLERSDAHTYALNIHATQDSDSGEYHCRATPWYVSASTGVWTQGAELTSDRLFLAVHFAMWDSLKLPLLYGAVASVSVGLFSLLLGLVCAHCCCRNTTHTPRSRNKLMDLEMD
ncbi:prostaglandin F2 receptor negative regulator [Esox lucius]|uniref:Ig-like domain-containing protein n=1 Tax=Esox lucius TaxID=8010 RepID=A0A3P8XIW3_ESOLU|nr:prostaglandin F2 receptor negative regulator [Esox lucius]